MTPTEGPAARWRRLVRARFDEVERLSGGEVRIGPSFWDQRAERYGAVVGSSAMRDPLLGHVARHVGHRTVVLDVGAGSGRFSVALAPRAAEVIAVDVSQGMLDVLRREADRRELENIRTVHSRWEDAAGVSGDVAICSYVLPLIEDVASFLTKLDQATARHVFLYLGAGGAELLLDPIWRYFHGSPRAPAVTYLDAVAVLDELGIRPDVQIVEVRTMSRFATLDEAVSDYRRTLLLPDTDETREELRTLLAAWLVPRDGALGIPARTMPAAIVSWRPARASEQTPRTIR